MAARKVFPIDLATGSELSSVGLSLKIGKWLEQEGIQDKLEKFTYRTDAMTAFEKEQRIKDCTYSNFKKVLQETGLDRWREEDSSNTKDLSQFRAAALSVHKILQVLCTRAKLEDDPVIKAEMGVLQRFSSMK